MGGAAPPQRRSSAVMSSAAVARASLRSVMGTVPAWPAWPVMVTWGGVENGRYGMVEYSTYIILFVQRPMLHVFRFVYAF